MINVFDEKIKALKQELTDLKTAAQYTSVRSSSYVPPTQVHTGSYQINYEEGDEPIMSKVYIDADTPAWLRTLVVRAYLRTPTSKTQVLDINTTIPDSNNNPVTYNATITILSNRSIKSIVRL